MLYGRAVMALAGCSAHPHRRIRSMSGTNFMKHITDRSIYRE
jgi:hypothetical protein